MHNDNLHRIGRLPELAQNLWWAWDPGAQQLFKRLDPGLWEKTEHNPVRLLAETGNMSAAADDAGFVDAYHQVMQDFDKYLTKTTWFQRLYPGKGPIAYFSAEFGLHESLPIYSGGLGILAGDHIKSASDLGVPLVGVGILYAHGYFRQRLNAEGWQEEVYEPFEPKLRPIQAAKDTYGNEVEVRIDLPGRELKLKVWQVTVGRTYILLLDADVPGNSGEDRRLTERLYGGDQRVRIIQELILGVGGVRALRAVGLNPSVYHMNEGHAAFLGLERMRELVAAGSSFMEAREQVARSSVFTTHTPVPAGHDAFSPELFGEFMNSWPDLLATSWENFWSLGHKQEPWGAVFNMTVLAFNLSMSHNAVSKLHGNVSLEMWSYLWPEYRDGNRPITYITNGIHTWSWLAGELASLFDSYASGRVWRNAVQDPAAWSFVAEIPPEELWETHQLLKERMLRFVKGRLDRQLERAGLPLLRGLDPNALTIGFARRFATYKRATLLLNDPERLKKIAGNPERPVQFIFAGKAHPADNPGKEFIQALYRASRSTEFEGRLVILEDYDMNVARHLVQGVDVWLNNPRRPLEASGTSGQKASLNGAPNFSVLDGWWCEGYNGENGWAIGEEKEYPNQEAQDAADTESLYRTLEEEITPLYYSRDGSGTPLGWVTMMKEAIQTIAPAFSTQRMVRDYVHKLYIPRTVEPTRTRKR